MESSEDGQGTIFVAIAILVLSFVTVYIGSLATEVSFRNEAQTAADAAALAGATHGQVAAQQAAKANNGTLQSFQQMGQEVIVEVDVNGRDAKAKAKLE